MKTLTPAKIKKFDDLLKKTHAQRKGTVFAKGEHIELKSYAILKNIKKQRYKL